MPSTSRRSTGRERRQGVTSLKRMFRSLYIRFPSVHGPRGCLRSPGSTHCRPRGRPPGARLRRHRLLGRRVVEGGPYPGLPRPARHGRELPRPGPTPRWAPPWPTIPHRRAAPPARRELGMSGRERPGSTRRRRPARPAGRGQPSLRGALRPDLPGPRRRRSAEPSCWTCSSSGSPTTPRPSSRSPRAARRDRPAPPGRKSLS